MKPTSNYQTNTDAELVKKSSAGDMNALFYLIEVKYQNQLYGVICKQLKDFGIEYPDKNLLDYWLDRFYKFMSVSTKKGKSKIGSIENVDKVSNWLCQCCKNFLVDDEEFKNPVICEDSDKFFDIEFMETTEYQSSDNPIDCSKKVLKQFILTIVAIDQALTDFEKYIVFTDLYARKKYPDMTYLNKKIASALSTSEGSVKKTKNTVKDKIKSFVNKTKNTGEVCLMKNIEECYDRIYIIRKSVMKKLEIDSDFIENDIDEKNIF
jgi:hypothetical protein